MEQFIKVTEDGRETIFINVRHIISYKGTPKTYSFKTRIIVDTRNVYCYNVIETPEEVGRLINNLQQ